MSRAPGGGWSLVAAANVSVPIHARYPAVVDSDALMAAYVDVYVDPPRVLLRCGVGGGSEGGSSGGGGGGIGGGAANGGGRRRAAAAGKGANDIAAEDDAADGYAEDEGGDRDGASSGEKGWRVAAPPPGNTVAPAVWAVPAGIAWHALMVGLYTLRIQLIQSSKAPGDPTLEPIEVRKTGFKICFSNGSICTTTPGWRRGRSPRSTPPPSRWGPGCTLTPPAPYLKDARYPGGFNPCTYQVKKPVSKCAFYKCELAPLRCGDPGGGPGTAGAGGGAESRPRARCWELLVMDVRRLSNKLGRYIRVCMMIL
jgi:hypothetical protein